jgi:hypothetical protein
MKANVAISADVHREATRCELPSVMTARAEPSPGHLAATSRGLSCPRRRENPRGAHGPGLHTPRPVRRTGNYLLTRKGE